ncbi:transcription termination factor MTERF9, chloroplastic [Ricinus communis]|uniref:Transcription termination factor MTERF9, chloroplastic n=1 Tax=Ricinus communis TaxID=3988 RepID=B9SST4_RICCO|nr:transcription termination factor MTERF9, chloroplastic [Ricinus communis]XP_015580762.1 transcription termination factor MTERF9, chloroplastic [Ricinus communis]EEF33364.1 conserved hypothetical protein [Ricinus communis]|eukprot:XP_002529053.1 transcription termination factor MTERF9, chloroplastic [Ricinus communis]
MAVSCMYPFNNPTLPSQPHLFLHSVSSESKMREFYYIEDRRRRRSRVSSKLVVLSTHSNAKILKSNRKSRFGQTLSPYASDDDEEEEEDDDDDNDSDKSWFSDDEFAEPVDFKVNGKRFKLQKKISERQGGRRQLDAKIGRNTQEKRIIGNFYHTKNKTKQPDSMHVDRKERLMSKEPTENRYEKLSEEIDLDNRWLPLLDYLCTFGLKESDFIQMYERHMPSLQINVSSAQERLEYLLSVGVKHRDIRRILLRQPQILEYTVDNNLKSHVAFLSSLGIPNSRIGQIIAVTPSLFSYSVQNSLKPTVRYLVEELGINEKNIGKVVQLSPQILVQRIDISWNTRYIFLSKELGASKESVVKMVTKHPQLLHYSIDDGFVPRINFLRSIGMRNSDILKVLTSLTQVLSLSLEDNLKPKYKYLINELRNEVQSLTKYPMYLSLSLDQRIRPRHKFLVALKKAPKGPFPLSSFVPTDECFCQQWAGTSVEKYLAFRQQLLLNKFAKKYERLG